MESRIFVKSLGCNSLSFIKVDNIPLLMLSSIITPDSNSLTFFIFTSFSFKDLIFGIIDELFVLILEHLVPSRVSAPDLHVVGSTR
jgi:hypothetical protein